MGGHRLHRSNVWAVRAGVLSIFAILLVSARSALGVPAFARKYGTSCLTCHTIYPKLNPVRRGVPAQRLSLPRHRQRLRQAGDGSAGPGRLQEGVPRTRCGPARSPAACRSRVGFNGQAVVHPNRNAGGAAADNGARFILDDLIEEGHIWAGGSFDDQITFFGELTVRRRHVRGRARRRLLQRSGGGASTTSTWPWARSRRRSRASRRTPPTSSTWRSPPLSVTALYGATSDSWNVAGAYNGLEVNGTIAGASTTRSASTRAPTSR